METFGKTTISGAWTQSVFTSAGDLYCAAWGPASPVSTGEVKTAHAYMREDGSGSGEQIRIYIYTSDGNLVENGVSSTAGCSSYFYWNWFTFDPAPTVSATMEYYLLVACDQPSSDAIECLAYIHLIDEDPDPTASAGGWVEITDGTFAAPGDWDPDTDLNETSRECSIHLWNQEDEFLLGNDDWQPVYGAIQDDRYQLNVINPTEDREILEAWFGGRLRSILPGSNQKFFIFDSDGDIIHTSIEGSHGVGDDLGKYGWYSYTFATNPVLTSGSKYYIGMLDDPGNSVMMRHDGPPDYESFDTEDGTYASPTGFTLPTLTLWGESSMYVVYSGTVIPPPEEEEAGIIWEGVELSTWEGVDISSFR